MIYLNPMNRMAQQALINEALLTQRNRPLQSPVAGLTVVSNSGTYGAVVSFSLGSAAQVKGFASLRLLRSQGTDPAAADVINTWSITESDGGKNFSYTDSDKSLATNSTNYWIQSIPSADQQSNGVSYPAIYAGPVNLAQLNGDLLPPDPVSDFGCSLMPGSNGVQVISVAYRPPADPRFAGVRVFVSGYEGNPATVAIAESTYSPFQFTLNQTGETINIYAYSISVAGLPSLVSRVQQRTLNGTGTQPAKLQNVSAQIINGETQIDFDAGAESNITSYKVYRAVYGADFSTAQVIQTVTASGSNHYTVVDPQGLNSFYDYYVIAVSPLGGSIPSTKASTTPSPQNLDRLPDGSTYFRTPQYGPIIIDNPNFEASTTLPPPGWLQAGTGTLSYETASPQSGKQSLKISSVPAWNGVRTTKQYQVVAGDSYKLSAYMKADGWASGKLVLNFYDGSGNSTGFIAISSGTGTSWNFFSATGTVPAGSSYAIMWFQNETSNTGTIWLDNVAVVRISSLDDEVWDGTTYFKSSNFPALSGGIENGNFEASGTILPPPGWAVESGNPVLSYETTSQQSGRRSLKMAGTAGDAVWQTKSFKVVAGEIYKLSGWAKASGCTPSLQINFKDLNDADVGGISAVCYSANWTSVVGYGTVPSTACCARLYCYIPIGTGTAWYDNVTVTKVASLDDEVADGSTYVRPGYVNADHTFHGSTVLKTQGSIIPAQPIVVNYTYSSSYINLNWSQQTMLAADGSNFMLYAGSATYTGLSASTRYNIFPFIGTMNGTMGFTNGSPPPSGTTPQPVLAAQQSLDGRIPVSPLFITTAATGSPGGGGDGGGGDICPEASELVEVQGRGQIPAGDVVAGDMILGMNMYDESDVYRRVLGTSTKECAAWRIVTAHKVSPCEPVWWDEQWMPAFRVPGSTFDGSPGVKVQITVEADKYDQANYFLVKGPRLLIHNTVMPPC